MDAQAGAHQGHRALPEGHAPRLPVINFFLPLHYSHIYILARRRPSKKTATLHRDDCVHSVLEGREDKGVNEKRKGGGWFSFESVGEAMRFRKEQRLAGTVVMCSYCDPLSQLTPELMASLNVHKVKNGCDIDTRELVITDIKSHWKRLTKRLFDG